MGVGFQRCLAFARTSAVGGTALYAQDERVALRRARVPGQHVLQHRDELVAMAGHHARVVDGWRAPQPRQSVHGAHCLMYVYLYIWDGTLAGNGKHAQQPVPPMLREHKQKTLTLLTFI